MKLSDAFDRLERLQAAKAKNTIGQTTSILKHLRPFFDRMDLSEFVTDYEVIWADYVVANRNDGSRKLTHDRRYLVMALKRAYIMGWITKPFIKSDFHLKEAHTPIGRALEDDEIRRLLEALTGRGRIYLQVLMALTMGMRLSEILQLRKEEVDIKNRSINLDPNRLKIRAPRKEPIPITDDVWALLLKAFEECQGIYIFPSVVHGQVNWNKPQGDNSYHWNVARRRAQVDCRFHDLRHTCISIHFNLGMIMSDAVKFFGATHQVLQTIYAHTRPEARDAFRSRLSLVPAPHTAKPVPAE